MSYTVGRCLWPLFYSNYLFSPLFFVIWLLTGLRVSIGRRNTLIVYGVHYSTHNIPQLITSVKTHFRAVETNTLIGDGNEFGSKCRCKQHISRNSRDDDDDAVDQTNIPEMDSAGFVDWGTTVTVIIIRSVTWPTFGENNSFSNELIRIEFRFTCFKRLLARAARFYESTKVPTNR